MAVFYVICFVVFFAFFILMAVNSSISVFNRIAIFIFWHFARFFCTVDISAIFSFFGFTHLHQVCDISQTSVIWMEKVVIWKIHKWVFWTWIWLPVLTTSLLQKFESRWMSIKRKYIWTVRVINEPYHGLLYLLHKCSRPQRYVYCFSPRWSISSRNSCICNWLI